MKICPIDAAKIRSMIEIELQWHPILEPVDLYKLLYQGLYGPNHIVRDFKQLCLGIDSELWQMQNSYEPLFQDVGPCYTRISLNALKQDKDIKMRRARIESLASWILASSVSIDAVSADFIQKWRLHKHILTARLPATPQLWSVADQLAESGTLPSHSSTYHRNYHPHYRLINPNQIEHKQKFMELNT
jgi:hypothetical protein